MPSRTGAVITRSLPDEHAVEAVVVDRGPLPVDTSQDHVRPGDRRVQDAKVGADVAPDDHIASRREACAEYHRS